MYKDYQSGQGVIEQINSPYNYITTEEVFIKGESDAYYLHKGKFKYVKKGDSCEYKYGKRSRIILDIKPIENK